MKKNIILLLILSAVGNCLSTDKKDITDSRWNDNCPYTEDNCGYPYESYIGDYQLKNEKKTN